MTSPKAERRMTEEALRRGVASSPPHRLQQLGRGVRFRVAGDRDPRAGRRGGRRRFGHGLGRVVRALGVDVGTCSRATSASAVSSAEDARRDRRPPVASRISRRSCAGITGRPAPLSRATAASSLIPTKSTSPSTGGLRAGSEHRRSLEHVEAAVGKDDALAFRAQALGPPSDRARRTLRRSRRWGRGPGPALRG